MDLSLSANPGMPRGGIVPLSPVLAPGSASGRVPALPYPPSRLRQYNPKGYDRANSLALDLARRSASAPAATLSQSFSQKSRGMQPLYWLGVPSRRLQRLNLLPIRSIALIQVTLLRQKSPDFRRFRVKVLTTFQSSLVRPFSEASASRFNGGRSLEFIEPSQPFRQRQSKAPE